MDTKAGREPATAGQAVTGTQASALDIAGQRTRDLQKRGQSGVTVDFEDELPTRRQASILSSPRRTGLGEFASPDLGA